MAKLRSQSEKKLSKQKPNRIHSFRLKISKLSRSRCAALGDWMISRILSRGYLKDSQENIGRAVDLCRETTNRYMRPLVKLKIIKVIHGKHKWDPYQNGICTYYLGESCQHIDLLKILVEQFPSLNPVLEEALKIEKATYEHGSIKAIEKLRSTRVINNKKYVTALSNLNNNPCLLNPNYLLCLNKQERSARDKILEKKNESLRKRAIETVENLKNPFAEIGKQPQAEQSYLVKQPSMVKTYPIKQPSTGQNYPEKQPNEPGRLPFNYKTSKINPVAQANPFIDIGNSTPEQLKEQEMRIKNLQMGRSNLRQPELDTWSGVRGVTPTKRWEEEVIILAPEEKTRQVQELAAADDSPSGRWFKSFIGEENAHNFLSRVITNVMRE